jgi:serine/threonine-protein kinase
LIGTLVGGRHRVDARLAAGGHAVVYRGVQFDIDRAVAIKVLSGESADPVLARRFEAEARILCRLRHPNTVGLIDFGHLDDGRPYLVSPLLEGGTLADRLARGPLAASEVRDVMGQVARALEDAHEQGVVHRDLKPSNLILQTVARRLVVRVIDFGIAQHDEDIRLTAEAQSVGTAAYMSPEQIRGDRVDARSDLYSLGVVAYRCLAGRLPFDGPTRMSVALQHLHDPPPALEGDPKLVEVVEWCMAKRPGDRPPDATALIEALEDIASGEEAPVAEGGPPVRTGVRRVAVGLALGVAAVGALVGLGLAGGRQETGPAAVPDAGTRSVLPADGARAEVTAPPSVAAEPPASTPVTSRPAAAPSGPAIPAREAATPARTPPATPSRRAAPRVAEHRVEPPAPPPESAPDPPRLVEPTPPKGLF